MEKVYYIAKDHITHFKLEYCCWVIPVRIGLMLVGYINIIIDLVCIMCITKEGLSPTMIEVQETMFADLEIEPNLSTPIVAYTIELAFNVILLCAVYRRDLVLLRVFLYYTVLAVLVSMMAYFIVIAAVPFHIQLVIILTLLFQMYRILLIRSVMVTMKTEDKSYQLPRLVMSSLVKRPTPRIYEPNNGKIKEVIVEENPKKQEVQLTVLGQDEKSNDPQVTEIMKVTEVPLETDLNKCAEVNVHMGLKKNDNTNKEHTKSTEERKIEGKTLKEKKKIKEKTVKEEKKKEDMIKEEKTSKEEDKKNDNITSLILKKYKDDKDAENKTKTKDLKERWLQATANEHPEQ